MLRRLAAVGALAVVAGCARTLPAQDRRITVTPAIAKMPAEDLWKAYKDDQRAADQKYWGKAIEVSGKVSTILGEPSAPQAVRFIIESDKGIRAFVLDDEAAEILKSVAVGQHLRLKCFCAGLEEDVVLRSCIQPK